MSFHSGRRQFLLPLLAFHLCHGFGLPPVVGVLRRRHLDVVIVFPSASASLSPSPAIIVRPPIHLCYASAVVRAPPFLRRSATPTALRLLFGPFKSDQAGFPVVSSAVIRLLPSLAIPVGSRSGHYCFSQAFHWLVSVWPTPSSSSVSPILFRRHHCSCRRLSSRRHRSSPYLAIPAVLDVVQLLQSLYSRCLAILAALTVSVVLVFLVVSRTTLSCTHTLLLTAHLNIRLLRILLRRPLAQHHCVALCCIPRPRRLLINITISRTSSI